MEDNFQYYAREKQKKRKKRKENFFQIHHKQTTGGRAIAFSKTKYSKLIPPLPSKNKEDNAIHWAGNKEDNVG